ncbi:MAG: site-specific integrase, partial [Chloroflexota bacterium]
INQNFKLSTRERNLLKSPFLNSPNEYRNTLFTLEEITKFANTPVSTLLEERTRAAAIFLYLTAMRIGAFVTLPIKAVDLEKRLVRQFPSLGIHTKLGKSATTRIIDIPEHSEFMEIVQAWDTKVRDTLPANGMWYANISPITGDLETSVNVGAARDDGFRDDLKMFCQKAGIAYKSPHKFRHGNIRYLRDNARTMRDFEAIAHNTMQTPFTMFNYGKQSGEESLEILDTMSGRNIDETAHLRQSAYSYPQVELLAQLKSLLAQYE